ncbi:MULTISPECIES: hypothetical protein [unclassified Saccharibacter]|uniref:hypothetical protein n=1 Tax=unclassified Saccharibacter TaxID=2648722 RepID=UPI001322E397|nr:MULTISPECIES: hypothetical protein [unclassified Saccharibacter]MXV36181.1 hypothetical protein [Saccharibacter sp. EH611]MXV57040.1 hypothetical protein [Saccharibacter sp. EH70]MXV66600.1 hypothetical protein [Saccharibacter sp. EH60]
MQYLNIAFALLAFLAWGGLFFVYYRERIIPWFVNRFTRDKPPKASEENSLFGGAAPLPFKYETEEQAKEKREKEIALIEAALQAEKEAAMKEDEDTHTSSSVQSKEDNPSSEKTSS